jgi:tetratricopeptide (TPR) repeat protein
MDAAEAVCGDREPDVVDTLIRLVDQSMVVAEAGLESGTRYRLLETLRQYGWQRLEERGESVEIHVRHADFVSRIAEEARPHLHGWDHGTWMRRLDAEHENCRVALDWCRDTGEVETYLHLVALWGEFWIRFGLWTEARRRLNEALDLEGGKHPKLRLEAILASAEVFVAEDRDRVVALADEALDLADRHGDTEARVRALIFGGYTAKHNNDHVRGVDLLERALQLCDEEGMEHERARALVTMGNIFSDRDSEQARYYLETGLRLNRDLENLSGVAQALHYLGAVATKRGDLDEAVAWLEEGLRVDAQIGGRDNSGHLLMEMGNVKRLQADTHGATKLLSKALEFLIDAGDENCAARTRTRLGLLALSEGSFADAKAYLATGLVASARIGDGNVVTALEGLAHLAAATGDPQQAVVVFSAAEGIRRHRDMTIPVSDLDQRGRKLDAVRQQLGKTAFDTAWDSGSAMSIDDAVAFVSAPQSIQ